MTETRIGWVEVLPPHGRAGELARLPVWPVRVLQPDLPPGDEALEWVLLSSEGSGRRSGS